MIPSESLQSMAFSWLSPPFEASRRVIDRKDEHEKQKMQQRDFLLRLEAWKKILVRKKATQGEASLCTQIYRELTVRRLTRFLTKAWFIAFR